MNQQEFEDLLRFFLRRDPFQPFVIDLLDGRTLEVDAPSVAFGGGAGGFITAEHDVLMFACEQVRSIRESVREVSA